MSRPRKNHVASGGPGDILDNLWHYDGENSYREFDDEYSGWFGGLFRRSRTHAERAHDKFTQFMSAGGVKFEDPAAREKEQSYLRKGRIIRWLAILAAVWTVFRFVSL